MLVQPGQRQVVEDRAQVDVEALGPLPGEYLYPVAQVVHGLAGQRGVVRARS
jgi:hypothetical protein